eukprot:14337815-Alexandrium_andersonii.AAC.1
MTTPRLPLAISQGVDGVLNDRASRCTAADKEGSQQSRSVKALPVVESGPIRLRNARPPSGAATGR